MGGRLRNTTSAQDTQCPLTASATTQWSVHAEEPRRVVVGVGLVSPGQWLARLSSGKRLRRHVGQMESRLVLVCVWRGTLFLPGGLLEQLPDTVHTAFACRWRSACCTVCPSVHQQNRPDRTSSVGGDSLEGGQNAGTNLVEVWCVSGL